MKKKLSGMIRFWKSDFIAVTAGTVFASALSFLFSIIARRFVLPAEYGIYSACLLLQTYLAYAQSGVMNAYNRDYPQIAGAGDLEKSVSLKNTVITFVLTVYAVLDSFACICLLVLFHRGGMSEKYFFGYMASLGLLLISHIADFGINTMRMDGKYYYTSFVTAVRSILSAVTGLAAIYKYGYYGLYAMPAAAGLVSVIFCYKGVYRNVRLSINKELLKGALKTGFPLMINGLVWTAAASVDKLVILGFMDTERLGIYSIAQIGFSFMVLIPQSVSQVFYIKISAAYGRSKDRLQLLTMCGRYSRINTVCTSAVCVAGFYLLPVFVTYVMPEYTDGIQPAQIMLIGIVIYGSTMLYGNIFSVLKMNRELLWTSAALCLFNAVFSVGLVLISGTSLNCIALGTSVSYAAFSVLMMHRLSETFGICVINLLKQTWNPMLVTVLPPVAASLIIPGFWAGFILSAVYTVFICVMYLKKERND